MLRKPEHVFLLFLLCFLAVQIPFLQADPHPEVSPYSRDAFTDEGLNTSQVTNKVNHGYFGVDECDNLIKTPLFSAWLYPAYKLFGTTILAGRTWVLLGCLFLLLWISRKERFPVEVLMLSLFTVFLQYHVFQYLHFTMAEASSTLLILAALVCILQYAKAPKVKFILGAAAFLWAAVFTKNQFAYALPLLPGWIVLVHLQQKTLFSAAAWKNLFISLGMLAFGALVYYLIWYLPVKETYDYVMADQADGRFIPLAELNPMATDHAREFLTGKYMRAFTWFCLASIPLFLVHVFTSSNKTYTTLSLLLLLWALFEVHKFAMWFVPSRYLVPVLISWGLFATVQFAWALQNALNGKVYTRLLFLFYSLFFLWTVATHLSAVNTLHQERSFAILETNRYLAKLNLKNRTVAGPWAPTLARESGAKVIPVWYGYFNDEFLMEKHNPRIIISEKGETDSGGAFEKRGIYLHERADSTREVNVAHYNLVIYFLP